MAEDVDFIITDLKIIERPNKPELKSRNDRIKDQSSSKGYQIEKSFIPQQKSMVHEQLRPEIQKMKAFLKAKKEKEKKLKQLLAEGAISKHEYEEKNMEKQKKQKKQDENNEKLIVDESGQLRDEKGNLVFVKSQRTQLMINQKKEHELTAKQLSKKQKLKFHEKLSRNLLDRNIVIGSSKRRKRRSLLGLRFLEKGSYQSQPNIKVNEIADLNQALMGEHYEYKAIKKRQNTKLEFNRDVPPCQPWDQQILKDSSLNFANLSGEVDFNQLIDIAKLNNEVVYQKVGDEKNEKKVTIPVYLTKDERKKLKRKRKREKLLQKNDLVRLGLIEPEKPRLKVSNMAIVMKDEFIMDPSRVEAEAKKQEQERLNKHLLANNQRKLTKSQKKDKVIRKLKRDSAKQCRRVAFRLQKLDDPAQAFKVNMNAKQLALNGFIIKPNQYHRQPVLIMAEGGQKAIRFFKNLMLNRIRWNENSNNSCKLLWEGEIETSKLGKWHTYEVGDESETIRTLTQKNVQNFFQYLM